MTDDRTGTSPIEAEMNLHSTSADSRSTSTWSQSAPSPVVLRDHRSLAGSHLDRGRRVGGAFSVLEDDEPVHPF